MNPTARFPKPAPAPGVYYGVPGDEYHQWAAVSSSMVKAMAAGPKVCRHFLDKHDEPKTGPFYFGSAVEAALFEPEVYMAATEIDKLSPKAKAETFAKHAKEHGHLVLAEGWKQQIRNICRLVGEMPEAAELCDGGRPQVSVVWDEITVSGRKIRCKARLDYCQPARMVELKSTDHQFLDDDAFVNRAWRLGYHTQIAHQCSAWFAQIGTEPWCETSDPEVAILVVTNNEPVDVVPFYPDSDWLDAGDLARDRLLDRIAICLETNDWPGQAGAGRRTLGKPRWAREEVLA